MEIQAAEISSTLKQQIANFDTDTDTGFNFTKISIPILIPFFNFDTDSATSFNFTNVLIPVLIPFSIPKPTKTSIPTSTSNPVIFQSQLRSGFSHLCF